MTTTVELYDSVNGTATLVNNVNFRNSSNPAHEYYLYPVRRPVSDHVDLSYSYTKVVFFKFSSTGPIKNYYINIDLAESGVSDTQLFYRFDNNDSVSAGADHNMTYIKDRKIKLFPFVSSTSPSLATTRIPVLTANINYYTGYLKLQTRAMFKENNTGNGDSIKLQFLFDTF